MKFNNLGKKEDFFPAFLPQEATYSSKIEVQTLHLIVSVSYYPKFCIPSNVPKHFHTSILKRLSNILVQYHRVVVKPFNCQVITMLYSILKRS